MNADTIPRTLWFLLVGDPGVGKTTFFNALKGRTVEDEIYRYSYNRKIKRYFVERGDVKARVHVYDVAQGRPDINIHYSGVDGVLFLYDITKKDTFTNLTTTWIRDCNKHAPPGTNKVIVGNMFDQRIYKTVGKSTARKFADSLGVPVLESSALAKVNVEEAILALAKGALDRYFPDSRTASVTLSIHEPAVSNLPPPQPPPPSLPPATAAKVGSQPKPDVSAQNDVKAEELRRLATELEPRRDYSAPSDSGYDSIHPGAPLSPSEGVYEPSPAMSVKPPLPVESSTSTSLSLSGHAVPLPLPEATSRSDGPLRVESVRTPVGFDDVDGVSASGLVRDDVEIGIVVKELELIFGDEERYESLLGVRGGEAQMVMDILQKLLDCQEISEELRGSVFKAMWSVGSSEMGVYPRLMALRGIRYEGVKGDVSKSVPGKRRKGYYGIHPLSVQVIRDREHNGSRSTPTNDTQPQPISKYIKEALTLSELNHPNVLSFYGIFYLDNPLGQICVVTPWMQSLHRYLSSGNPDAPRLAIVFDILSGLKYLHDNSIIHGDLRGANVLVNLAGTACLGNFCPRNLGVVDMLRPNEGLRWQAPELMDELEDGDLPCPTAASDVYSVASVMYEILTGQIPFHEVKRDITIVSRVSRGIRPTKPTSSALTLLELNDEIWQIMQQCWMDEPGKRLTVHQVLEQLREVRNLDLTNVRLWKAMLKEKETGVMPLSVQSFRSAMRGCQLGFSMDEVDALRKCSR